MKPQLTKYCVKRILQSMLCAVMMGLSQLVFALSSNVVISQIYGGGGNAGAPFNSDFVELFNRGTTTVTVTGWTLQYAADVSAIWTPVPLVGSLAAGQYYLIKLGNGGVVGAALPTPDASLVSLNINAAAGKVALVNNAVTLAVSNPVGLAQVVDFVGYGTTANAFETAVALAPSNTASSYRAGLGCKETDNNATDFLVLATPLPRNTTTSAYSCNAVLLGQYRMEEATWPVGVGSVKDTSGNLRHGDIVATTAPTTAATTPARTGNPGTCGYGVFATAAGSTGRINIPNLPVNTAIGAQTTVTFWMKWNGVSGTMPVGWQLNDLWFNGGGFGFNTAGSDVYGTASPALNGVWKHVTAVFTNGTSLTNSLYIDGVLQPFTLFSGNFIPANAVVATTLRVGGWGNDNNYKFSGSLDELKVYNGALTQSQVTANYNETHPCGALLSVQKTVALLCDPVNGTAAPKNIPGAVVQYTLTTTNTGVASASLTQIADTVVATTLFDANFITGAGTPAVGCNTTTGTPNSATGRGFSVDVTGDTRGASYPKYLTTTNADSDGASHSAGSVAIDFAIALPAEAGYTAGEIKPNESVIVKFNVVVQ